MRSNELRDDGASLTTFEDLAPIFYFYGSACDMGWAALRDSALVPVAAVRDLISDLSLGHWAALWSSEARDSSRILAAQRVETLATAMHRQTVVIHASDTAAGCEGVERLRGLAPVTLALPVFEPAALRGAAPVQSSSRLIKSVNICALLEVLHL